MFLYNNNNNNKTSSKNGSRGPWIFAPPLDRHYALCIIHVYREKNINVNLIIDQNL